MTTKLAYTAQSVALPVGVVAHLADLTVVHRVLLHLTG
jgi:hypothetical protein